MSILSAPRPPAPARRLALAAACASLLARPVAAQRVGVTAAVGAAPVRAAPVVTAPVVTAPVVTLGGLATDTAPRLRRPRTPQEGARRGRRIGTWIGLGLTAVQLPFAIAYDARAEDASFGTAFTLLNGAVVTLLGRVIGGYIGRREPGTTPVAAAEAPRAP